MISVLSLTEETISIGVAGQKRSRSNRGESSRSRLRPEVPERRYFDTIISNLFTYSFSFSGLDQEPSGSHLWAI